MLRYTQTRALSGRNLLAARLHDSQAEPGRWQVLVGECLNPEEHQPGRVPLQCLLAHQLPG